MAEQTTQWIRQRDPMAWRILLVTAGELRLPASAETIQLDSPAWFAWVTDAHNRSFRFVHPKAAFTARKERKQRGHWYWVAYRQRNRKLHKTYLGKSETL